MSHSDSGIVVRSEGEGAVVITGVEIPYWDLVILITKVVLAALPACILLALILGALGTVFGGIFAGLAGARP